MRKTITKKVISILLCLVLMISYIPTSVLFSKADIEDTKITDPSTMNDWKVLFGPDALSTEYAGGVWTDKSVFGNFNDYLTEAGISQLQGPTSAITDEVRDMLNTGSENFLVAMSAIAANQQITGYTTTPTDTMLVLDMSQSMDNKGYIPSMVAAANATIKTLMSSNTNNRVGVVLFSGSGSVATNQGTGTATVLLPLDHYTSSNDDGTFLRYTGSTDTYVYIAQNVKNSKGDTMNSSTGKNTVGGTYTQNGLYKAWGQFSAADTVVPEGDPQAGTKRSPAIVLMTDGRPTIADNTYYNIGNSTIGDGTETTNETNADRMSFLTQLTAAWIKAKVADKYDINLNDVKFYTVGLGTSNDRYATALLNPSTSSDRINNYWNSFISATPNWQGQVTVRNGNSDTYTIYKSRDGMLTTADDRLYATQYFSASDTTKLQDAFKQIADSLTVGAPYVTLVSSGEANLDGYISFEDKLGGLMEVKSVKGLVIGDRIFTGAELAKSMNEGNLGSSSNPKDYGDELVRTVKERLGITDTAVAQQLIRSAYSSGQLSYTSATEYSNYIGWYADRNGNYKGFWQESDGYGIEAAPEGAEYINKSYGYLGAEVNEEGASDMMHVVVMVHTNIYTGDQTIIYKIPASLIPTVIYNIELEGTDLSAPKSITREDASPLQLLAEVGLRSDINEVNINQKVAEYEKAVADYAAIGGEGGHVHKHADGTYQFFTNKWGDGDGGPVNYDEPLTHLVTESHFYPAADNSRYYVTETTLLCIDENGTPYTGSEAPSGTGYYHARKFYEKSGDSVKVTTKYVPVSDITLAKVVPDGNQWFIPAGTPFQETERFRIAKNGNETGTLSYANYPLVLHDNNGYNVFAFLGNNGTFEVSPAQGIALSKTIAEVSDDPEAPTEFTFNITLSQAVANPVITDTGGNVLEGAHSVNGNVITVTLKAGETVVVTGIPAGVTYTVTEEETRYYTASSSNATGTVAAHTITPVEFVNTARGYGSLIVGKDVNYPQGFVPQPAHNNKTFKINVEFSSTEDIVLPEGESFNQGTNICTLELKDGDSAIFSNIPEGVTYKVTEGELSSGYNYVRTDFSDETKTVTENDVDTVGVVNSYEPAAAGPNVIIKGTKTVQTNNNDKWPDNAGFTVQLYESTQFAGGEFTLLAEKTLYENNRSYSFDLGNLPSGSPVSAVEFDEVGTYYFRVVEVIPEEGSSNRIENMAYDRTIGLFTVTVTDQDADGALEVSAVTGFQNTPVEETADGWTVTKNFTNVMAEDRVYLDIQKNVVDENGNDVPNALLADFTFTLFSDKAGTKPTEYYGITDLNGKTTIMLPVSAEELSAGPVTYYLREVAPAVGNRIIGMNYDESMIRAFEISWDSVNHKANVRYWEMENNEIDESSVKTFTRQNENDTIHITTVHNNTYKDVKTEINLSGNKTLTGRQVKDSDSFSFELYESSAAFIPRGNALQTVSVKSGKFAFAPAEFTSPGIYYFVAKEVIPTAENQIPGVTYDVSEYHITVEVEKYVNEQTGFTELRVKGGAPSIVKYGSTTPVSADNINFNNIYTITGTEEVQFSGVKLLPEREMLAGEFEFGLWEGNNTSGAPIHTVKNLTNGRFTFPVISYDADDIGTHIYTIKEIPHKDAVNGVYQGITYSGETYTVEVIVSDNGVGGLSVTKTIRNAAGALIDEAQIVITNHYNFTPTSVTLDGTKSWYDENAEEYLVVPANKFTFELYESNSTFTTFGNMVASVSNTGGTENDKDGTFSFKLDYDVTGDHYYILREYLGSDKGVAYDTTLYYIRVLVSDNGVGNLSAVVTMAKSGGAAAQSITFGNRYRPEPTTAVIEGSKVITGRDVIGEFNFELYAADEDFNAKGEALQTVYNELNGNFAFDAITYEKSGTYRYIVKEVIPHGAVKDGGKWVYKGVTYDTTEHPITVKVTDNKAGALEANVTYPNGGLNFSNSYEGASTSFDLPGKKVLTGRELREGETFTFYLYDADNNHVSTAHSDANGNFKFEDIPLDEARTYHFTVKEVIPADAKNNKLNGIAYSELIYNVTVDVEDNTAEGTLVALEPVITLSGSTTPVDLVFENVYTAKETEAVISVRKILENKNLTANAFDFELYAADANFGVQGEELQTVSNTAGGSVTFDDITYDKAGNYNYVIKEVIPEGAAYVNGKPVYKGVTYDTTELKVTVHVEDNGYGELIATVSYNGNLDSFTNIYTITESVTVDITGEKELTGREMKDGEFEFVLLDDSGAQIGEPVKNVGGKFVFENIELTESGNYTFTVKEVIPDGAVNTVYKGVDYDERVYTAYVTAYDNGEGGLIASNVIFNVNGVDITLMKFNNTYTAATTDVVISGEKTLSGDRAIKEGEFLFELYAADDRFAPQGEALQTVTNGADGRFEFAPITYNEAGTHNYVVKEVVPSGAAQISGKYVYRGVTYDTEDKKVQVTVTDNLNGSLTAVSDYFGNAGAVTFNNTYAVSGEVTLRVEGTKTLNGSSNLGGREFTFELYKTGSDYIIEGLTPADSAVSGATGAFGITQSYSVNDLGQTYYYVLKERNTGLGGVTYSTEDYRFSVKVDDNGDGTLKVTATSDDNLTITPNSNVVYVTGAIFNNTYTAQPVEYTPKATKVYEGDEMKTFDFVLSGEGINKQTKQNDNKGNVVFDELTFTEEGIYTLTVKEQANILWGFIKWDTNVYTIELTVKDNGKGELVITNEKVTSVKGKDDLIFRNVHEDIIVLKDVYNANEPDISIDGQKVKAGDTLLYTITYKNYAGEKVDVNITDAIPANTEYVEGSANNGGIYAGGKLTWSFDDVAPDDVIKVNFAVKVTGSNTTVVNQATVAEGSNEYTSNEVSNPVDHIVKDVFSANDTSVSIDGKKVNVGDTLLYTITYNNSGETAADLVITDTIPEHTTYVDGSADNGGIFTDGKLTWNLTLAANESKTVTFRVIVDDSDVTITNQAQGFDGINKIDSNIVTNHTNLDIYNKDVFKVSEPTVSIDGKRLSAGDTLQYVITYTNRTGETVDVTITDELSEHLTFVEDSADNGAIYEDGKIVWKINGVANESTVTVSFKAKVNAPNAIVANNAIIETGENKYQTNTVVNHTNEDTFEKDVFMANDPTVSVDGKKVNVGDTLLYTLTYYNADTEAIKVKLTDTIPEHTTYVDGSADNGGIFEDGKLTWNVTLAAGESKTVTFMVKVNDFGANIVNKANAFNGVNTLESNAVTTQTPSYVDTPVTGDSTNLWMWFALMFVSGSVIFGLTVIERKRRTEEE